MQDTASKRSRRQFLSVLGIGSAATVAALAYTAVPSSKVPNNLVGKRRGKGYQVTEHVQSYYRTAQV